MTLDYFEGAPTPRQPKAQPYFMYHIKKTGGISILSAIRLSFGQFRKELIEKGIVLPENLTGRIDNMEQLDLTDKNVEIRAMFIASHLPFGAHEKLQQDFRLITVLRRPWPRCLSNYSYLKMRSGTAPRLAEFDAFIADESNCNVMTKQLSGCLPEQPINEDDFNRALHNLKAHFHAFGVEPDLPYITSDILKANGLPNVVSERINPTAAAFKLSCDESDAFKARNAWDIQLYDYVSKNPRRPEADDVPPSPDTVLIREVGDHEKSCVQCLALSGDIKPFIKGTQASDDILEALNSV
ncbi:hypothetical protein F1188_11690 [Roseospira marina]|uniref:Sulfotransferase family protein n=1 Tax=Roseospira marina TaxID=140057 RepID=A0A5M6IC73_9PROT|nr:hypothetical protein [Roseospira marina]KAA5605228.1 hypothetical protein F1188_11690 [Roseospira marina]MBB4314684.1 hypothetical protein [Roseospira marina]MBB5087673.1 hypothetical protein [Roseospira marina]